MKWAAALQDYCNYLRIERGLSDNSITNYRLDVVKLINFLQVKKLEVSPIKISEEVLQQFIYEIARDVNARSQSRIISGIRGFFTYLVFEDYRKDNPLDLIESPKIGRKLPDTISTEEIDLLIETIDLSKAEG